MLVAFKGTLIDRGSGTGAKRIMDAHPERGEFIRRLTGWEQVEPGTLTLDHAVPLPLPALRDVSPLGEEPDDLLLNLKASDAQIAKKRGPPKYYGSGLGSYRPSSYSAEPTTKASGRASFRNYWRRKMKWLS